MEELINALISTNASVGITTVIKTHHVEILQAGTTVNAKMVSLAMGTAVIQWTNVKRERTSVTPIRRAKTRVADIHVFVTQVTLAMENNDVMMLMNVVKSVTCVVLTRTV